MDILVKYLFYLIFLVYCEAKITINITIASTKGGASVKFKGDDNKVITEREVSLFKVTDDNLKKGVRVEMGKVPDDIFLRDPTYYGNVYENYKWKQVNRNMKVKSAIIDVIINENAELKVHNHINNTTEKSKIKVKAYEAVETTTTSFWSKEGYHADNINYEIILDYYKTILNNTFKWRENNYKTATTLFGMKNVGYINIEPGKSVTTKLLAKKTILLLKIQYSAILTGSIVANYARLYGKYHFWAPSISNIMKAAKLHNEILTTEYIEVKCYTDPVIDVFDNETGKKIPMLFVNKPFRQRKRKH